jgi:NADH dehydrogenase
MLGLARARRRPSGHRGPPAGAVCPLVPGKPFSTDNLKSLLIDSVCKVNGLARLGIKPQPLEAILPSYLI